VDVNSAPVATPRRYRRITLDDRPRVSQAHQGAKIAFPGSGQETKTGPKLTEASAKPCLHVVWPPTPPTAARRRKVAATAMKKTTGDLFEVWRENEKRKVEKLAELANQAVQCDIEKQMNEGLKSIFQRTQKGDQEKSRLFGLGGAQRDEEVDCADHEVVDAVRLHELAVEMNMTTEDVLGAKRIFDSFDVDGSGNIDYEEFEVAVQQILTIYVPNRDELRPDRIKALCHSFWADGDKDNSGSIEFHEFLQWYSSNGFSEDILLSEVQREVRQLARTYHMSLDYVESIKRIFDSYDADESGELEEEEFSGMLRKCLRLPKDCNIPSTRVQYFWSQIDTDHSGKVTFSEFFQWWLKYFSERDAATPVEVFYKQVRRIGASHLDPPAYPPKARPSDMRTSMGVVEDGFDLFSCELRL
jgi:Ca2+-binding EF-hand superfamily protein